MCQILCLAACCPEVGLSVLRGLGLWICAHLPVTARQTIPKLRDYNNNCFYFAHLYGDSWGSQRLGQGKNCLKDSQSHSGG